MAEEKSPKSGPRPMGWTLKDKVAQVEETVRLFEGIKDWNIKLRQEKVETWTRDVRNLEKKEHALRRRVQTLKDGDRHGIGVLLKHDPYLEFRCRGKSLEEIENVARQAIFLKRKELDRLTYELQQKQELFLNNKYKVESMEICRQMDTSAIIHKTQEIETQLKNIKSKHQAALVLRTAYEKIRTILKKDATKYDTILTGVHEDLVLQCRNVIQALELGQMAMEDKAELKEKVRQTHDEYADLVTQREMQINTIKRKLNKVRQKCREVDVGVRPVEDDTFAGRSEVEDLYIAGLKEERKSLQYIVNHLKDLASTKTANLILPRVEHKQYKKSRLQRQCEINTSRLRMEEVGQQRQSVVLEQLLNAPVESLRGYHDEAWYETRIEECEESIEKIKMNMGFDSKIMFMIQMTLYDILSNLKHIAIESNDNEVKPKSDDPLGLTFLEPQEKDYEIVPNEGNYDDRKFIYTVTLLDALLAKIDLIRFQLQGAQLSRRSKSFSSERRGSRLRGHEKKSIFYAPAKPIIVNPCPPELVWRKEIAEGKEFEGHKLPTRMELKKRSLRLVEQFKERLQTAKKAMKKQKR